jgi:hypothetical protein
MARLERTQRSTTGSRPLAVPLQRVMMRSSVGVTGRDDYGGTIARRILSRPGAAGLVFSFQG